MTQLHSQTLRAIDANLDRATEGLRVLEDIARFCLNSSGYSLALKSLRHDLTESIHYSSIQLLSARDATADVGRRADNDKTVFKNLTETVSANARRVEQSLRVLEELARLPETGLAAGFIEQARYRVYEMEKSLAGALTRQERLSRLGNSYLVTGSPEKAATALTRQDTSVQLNDAGNRGELWRQVLAFSRSRSGDSGLLIIGEYADIAVAVSADGVAIDGGSLPPDAVRNLLSIDQLIGYAATDVAEAESAVSAGADYLICAAGLKTSLAGRVEIPVVLPLEELP